MAENLKLLAILNAYFQKFLFDSSGICFRREILQFTIWFSVPSNPTVMFRRTPEPDTFPGPPSKPRVANVQERSLQLSWTPNRNHGASKVFAYMVEYFSYETEKVYFL